MTSHKNEELNYFTNEESPTGDTMRTLVGEGVSPGLSKGRAFVYVDVLQRDTEFYIIDSSQIEEEIKRIEIAIDDVRQGLAIDANQIERKLGTYSSEIFRAQEAILQDASVVHELKRFLAVKMINAEQAVRTVFRLLARKFRDMKNDVFRDRGDDIDDLSRRLLLSLAGIHAHSLENLPENTVLVAKRLLPSDTVFLSKSSTVAVLAEFAGPAAHAALLARELGIPCVGGIPDLFETVKTGDWVILDGTAGTAVINPDAQTLMEFERSLENVRNYKDALVKTSLTQPTLTLDGCAVSVMANVRNYDDVKRSMSQGADGIGLFRTEPFFLAAKHFPTEKQFVEFLLYSLQPARGKPIDVRLLDIGADKNPIYLHFPPEPDPFLGRRGVRVLLKYPDLLEAQLRALLEVSRQFPIGILIPMVTTESDVTEIASLFHKLADDMGIRELPRLGAMIETPAAALSIPTLVRHLDFLSIGSNDLTQYTLAAGRENPLVGDYFIDDHPAVLRLIDMVLKESGGIPVSICGELAGRIHAIPRLIETGLRTLSVSAALVPDVKSAVRASYGHIQKGRPHGNP